MQNFKKGNTELIDESVFKLIGTDWMLVTSGHPESHNTMTASWGSLGVLWNKNIAIAFVRPSRHTYQFMEKQDIYTLSFFGEEHRDALQICGSRSGRDCNKALEASITPVETDEGCTAFAEARMIIECRKIYYQDLNPKQFLDQAINNNYGNGDYHRMYIGEILNVYKK